MNDPALVSWHFYTTTQEAEVDSLTTLNELIRVQEMLLRALKKIHNAEAHDLVHEAYIYISGMIYKITEWESDPE